MEEQSVQKTPQQWEDQYIQQLQGVVAQWENYTNQLKTANDGGFGTQDCYQALDYAKRIRVYFDGYDMTAKWFTDRQMSRMPDYLTYLKNDFDGVINIISQMYQDNLATDQKIFAINAQANTAMISTYNDIYLNQKKTFDEMNAKWFSQFNSK